MEWTGKITTGAYIKIHSLLNSYKRIVAIIFLVFFFLIVKSYAVNIRQLKKIFVPLVLRKSRHPKDKGTHGSKNLDSCVWHAVVIISFKVSFVTSTDYLFQ